MKNSLYAFLTALAIPASAFAITVTTPANNAQLTSPFQLVASTTACGSQPAVSMGYSLDWGATTIVKTSFSALVLAGDGQHILHVKCWGPNGASGVSDLSITIIPATTIAPPNATIISNIQAQTNWAWAFDPGTLGTASGSTQIVTAPSLSGKARQHTFSFTNYGGERYHTTIGADPAATHFIYDAQVMLTNPAAVANIEMDMNQVLANGDTVIYGVQCDGWQGTWDYTVNTGTRTSPIDTWVHSNIPCPAPKTWTANTWHHIQISYFRDTVGNVTYETVVLDGKQTDFAGATGNSAFALGWGSTLLTNFQLDGLGTNGAGSATAYLDNLTISRW